MKSKKNKNTKLNSIITHSFVIAIFVNPFLLAFVADYYKTVINDTSPAVVNASLYDVMMIISITALVVSATAFLIYIFQDKK